MSEINPGICRVVALLNDHGFTTCDSGDGETGDHTCDREVGYVSCTVSDPDALASEARRLRALLESRGVQLASIGDDGVYLQASYDPIDGVAILDVEGIHDRMLDKPS